MPEPILDWLGDVVLTSDQTEQAARAQTIKKLQARFDQIQARIETMYLDKLDGRITEGFFDKHSGTWHREQDGLPSKIQDVQKATPALIDQAVDMLRLTSRASEVVPPATRRRAAPVAPGRCRKSRLAGRGVADHPVRTVRIVAPFEPGKL
jgi:hypothetical protein